MLTIKLKTSNQIVALKDKEQVGYLNFEYPKDTAGKRNLEIPYVFVKPNHRREKIGSKMIQFLIKNKPNVTWISLWTGKEIEKQKAINFYKKNGFKKIANQEDYYEKGIGTSLFVKRIKRK